MGKVTGFMEYELQDRDYDAVEDRMEGGLRHAIGLCEGGNPKSVLR